MLKSTSLLHHRGLRAEFSVIRLLTNKSFRLLFQRARTKICEVDLVFEDEQKIILIEVKTLASSFAALDRVGKKQQQRLRANTVYLSRCYPLKIFKCYVAFVAPDNSVNFACVD